MRFLGSSRTLNSSVTTWKTVLFTGRVSRIACITPARASPTASQLGAGPLWQDGGEGTKCTGVPSPAKERHISAIAENATSPGCLPAERYADTKPPSCCILGTTEHYLTCGASCRSCLLLINREEPSRFCLCNMYDNHHPCSWRRQVCSGIVRICV